MQSTAIMESICNEANRCQTTMNQGLWSECGFASFAAEGVARGPSFPRRRIGADLSEVVHALGAVFLPLPLVGEGRGEGQPKAGRRLILAPRLQIRRYRPTAGPLPCPSPVNERGKRKVSALEHFRFVREPLKNLTLKAHRSF